SAIPALVADIEHLKGRGAKFTTDYRVLYREITGEGCQDCAGPSGHRTGNLNLRLIADKWLQGLLFPTTAEKAVERARAGHAPAEVVAALRKLEGPGYETMGHLLQGLLDQAHSHA